MGTIQRIRGRAEDEDTSLVLKDLQRWRLDRRKPQREICIRPKNKRILHCFALNTELQRILNDEPTEEEKKQHEILKAYRDEQKAVDDEHFAITFIPDSSEASRESNAHPRAEERSVLQYDHRQADDS